MNWALWNEEKYGQTSNLVTGIRSKVDAEGEFMIKARIEHVEREYDSESESESEEMSSDEFEDSSDDESDW